MQNLIIPPYGKRFAFTLLLILTLATLFWTQSRYPALDEKAMMSGAMQLEDPISFEAILPTTPDMPLLRRLAYSTVNWLETNRNGMAFGMLLGAAFLTLFGYVRQRSFRGGHLNALLGLVIGAPLGVCVNCAAPIAKGLYASGMRAETTLATMIASPTLNVVVLTLMISLLPFWMVVAKLTLSLAVILLGVPLICRLLPRAQLAIVPTMAATGWDLPDRPDAEPVLAALVAMLRAYGANLWFIVRTTAPLMLVAAVLGAGVATIAPPMGFTALPFTVGVLVLLALIGTFLPVPIAFDVVLVGVLLASGLAPGYVMVLLFTLGLYSVYSFFIIAGTISLRAGVLLGAMVAVMGVLAGLGAQAYHDWQTRRALEILQGDAAPFHLIAAAHAGEAPPVTVTAHPFAPRSPGAAKPFSRLEAREIGIDKPIEFSFRDMWPPFWEGRSLATGDYDHDGDIDLVIASTRAGLYFYDNDGAGRFSRHVFALGDLADMPVFNAALADVTNDGWPDLFVTTYRQGNYLLVNHGGVFDGTAAQPVANRGDAILTMALSFADPDGDGDLDVALGNWAAGWYRRVPGEESRNRLIFNDNGLLDGTSYADLPGIPGETLSILFADFNRDGNADLIVGNDFQIPDYFYRGDGSGGFSPITFDDQIIPHTTTTTMAVKVADLHNDAVPEIYLAQIAGRSSGVSETLKMQPLARYCASILPGPDRDTCARNMAIKRWYKSGRRFDPTYAARCQELAGSDRAECKAMLVKDLAIQQNDPSICRLIPKTRPEARAFCDIHFWPWRTPTGDEMHAAIPQILRSNVLLEREGGGFADRAEAQGLDVGGWSWDTKIADFDLDGHQDVYIVNGTWVPNEVSPSNLFFHNQGDGTFAEASGPFGLEDYLMTAAATAFDMDNDGDLDMITHPVNGPITVFRNNAQTGNAIAFEFRDTTGNRFGIGASMEIRLAGGAIQTRELQLGGGFMSFDAPRLHFGLGASDGIESATIRWPDGTITALGAMKSGALYRITRD